MKRLLTIALISFFFSSGFAQTINHSDPARYVNPFIGTGAKPGSLAGSNFPGAVVPFGMVQLSPDTQPQPDQDCSGYNYADSTIVGFSHTHLSGTGVADLFDVLVMPTVGALNFNVGDIAKPGSGYFSTFNHKDEHAEPGYYSVLLKSYDVKAELTASSHVGMHRYLFPKTNDAHILIDLDHSLDKKRNYWSCHIISAQIKAVDNQTIEGFRVLTGWAKLRHVYFVAKFSKPFKGVTLAQGNKPQESVSVINGTNIKAALHFDSDGTTPVVMKVGLSSVSIEDARRNLEAEVADWDFDAVKANAREQWNTELRKVAAEGSEKQLETFYTALYHTFIHPSNIAGVDGSYLRTDYTQAISSDKLQYSVFSLWDTFRAAHPLFTLLQEKRTPGFINSMLHQYDTYGYLPIWQLWGDETYCMIGNHAIPVIVDAYLKGIQNVDWDKAYAAIKASSTISHPNSPFIVLDKYGYFPEDIQTQSVSIAVETAFNDWCVAQMAQKMGKTDDYNYFSKRAEYYKNMFDKNLGFFRGKNKDGKWIEPFNPLSYGGNGGFPFTEGNAWQYLWFVPQDVPALMDLFGGREKFCQKLDTFFTLNDRPAELNGNASGFIGQYAHGNEPSHHCAYLYVFGGQPWKTQFYVQKIMNELYDNTASGLCGNEDCGQMSAWYTFSAMGFYPVNPTGGKYILGSPLLKKTVLSFENGNTFTVLAPNVSDKNIYVKAVKLNDKVYDKNYILHQDMMKGGKLEFIMDSKPNKKRCVGPEALN